MQNVILFGSTGHIGQAIAKEVLSRGYKLTAVVRNPKQARLWDDTDTSCLVLQPDDPADLNRISGGYDIVISALGKSVSPFDRSSASFREIDYGVNMNILQWALKAGVKKFVYVSAFHAEKYPHLEYFSVHHAFAEQLKASGLDYSIIKPPAVFSAFIDLIEMARKGRLVNIGKGDKKTNPIYEGDLARIVAESIHQSRVTIEAGGKNIYTRRQLNELVSLAVRQHARVPTIPIGLMKVMLPVIRLFNQNMYDKFAFFLEVMQHDTIAPVAGDMNFEEYLRQKVQG